MLHRLQQQALFGLPGNQGRSAVATLDKGIARIDAQTVADLGAAMAAETRLAEDRADLRFEEDLVLRAGLAEAEQSS